MNALIVKCFVVSAALVVALQISGCAGTDLGPASVEEQQAMSVAATEAPRLQRGEKIRVTVFGEDKLSGEYDIDPGGFLSMPLAGTVQAAGLTKTELEQALTKKFRSQYLKSPKVTVEIAAFRPFYVMGEVAKPGEYPFKSGLNVLSAIAIAGGPTYRAARNSILIQHPDETGFKEYPLSASIPIRPGDLVRVPERYF
jgi:protein involved in polysaccharide export with SLBB domain